MPAADYRILTDATGQRIAAALEGMSVDRAAKTDLTSIIATGTTNTTGATITVGTYFYLNGTMVQALTDIAIGATFTNGTNYETVTAGGLNALNNKFTNMIMAQNSNVNLPVANYPMGFSAFYIGAQANHGFPLAYGTVATFKSTKHYALQFVADYTNNLQFRVAFDGKWSEWQSLK